MAYIGDINLIGYRRPISYLREIVYGLRKNPYIAVERPEHYGEKCGKTPWMWKNNIASWTWKGQEGNPVSIDVYSDADEVEPVSYTHLDVYKRQVWRFAERTGANSLQSGGCTQYGTSICSLAAGRSGKI